MGKFFFSTIVYIFLIKNNFGYYDEADYIRTVKNAKNVEKLSLIVNLALHADYSVYLFHKELFRDFKLNSRTMASDDDDYIKTFLLSYYTKLVRSVNQAYQRFTHPFFKLELRLTDIHLQTIKPTSVYFDHIPWHNLSANVHAHYYLSNLTQYFINYYKYTKLNIAARAMITKFSMGGYYENSTDISSDVGGYAWIRAVCGDTSDSVISDWAYMSTVHLLGHEVLHTLGSEHDPNDTYFIMNADEQPLTIESLSLSDFTTKYLYDFYFGNETIPKFKINRLSCLLPNASHDITHPFAKNYPNILPGHVFSQTYQCMLIHTNVTVYACNLTDPTLTRRRFVSNELVCRYNGCSGPMYHNDTRYLFHCLEAYSGLMDGTPCGPNKICMSRECVENTAHHIPHFTVKKLELCPFGSYEDEVICEQLLYSNRMAVQMCTDKLYLSKCCQTCLKNSYNTCEGKGVVDKIDSKHVFGAEFFECTDSICKFTNYKNMCKLPTCESIDVQPCQNGGTCVTNMTTLMYYDRIAAFDCICPEGYSGPLCLDYSPCSFSNACPSGKRCMEYGDLGQHMCL